LACVGIDASPVTYRLIASPTFAALVVELMVTAFVKVSEFGTMVRVGKGAVTMSLTFVKPAVPDGTRPPQE